MIIPVIYPQGCAFGRVKAVKELKEGYLVARIRRCQWRRLDYQVPLIPIVPFATSPARALLEARFLGEPLSQDPRKIWFLFKLRCFTLQLLGCGVAARRYYGLSRQQIKMRLVRAPSPKGTPTGHTLSGHLIPCQCKNTGLTTTAQATHRRDGPGELRDLTFRVHFPN